MKLLAFVLGLSLLSMPAMTDDTKGPPRPEAKEKGACTGSVGVPPGGSESNDDGVDVSTSGPSNGSASLSPHPGTPKCQSYVNAKAGWSGDVTGLDSNDFASVAGGGSGQITGNGGLVSIGASGPYTVTNVGGPGASAMTVNWSGGPTVLSPGQSVTVP